MGQWSHLYNTRHWRAIRREQLQAHPLCCMCKAAGRITLATVCDHVDPHRGDVEAFYRGPFQSLCAPCHSGAKQQLERSGVARAVIGEDGWPVPEGGGEGGL